MNAESTTTCKNHPLVEANYNSILAGGDPLCLNCALAENESFVYSK